jgi:signal transduction histidine kinase/CheY-like chemotaxis protein/HPt (histidine-containing phosphotransfer) domain-containing protein
MGLIALIVVLLQVYLSFVAYRAQLAEAERLSETVVRMVEDQTQRSLQAILLVLETAMTDGAADELRLDHRALRLRMRSVPEIRGVYHVASNGRVLDSTLADEDIGHDVSGHDYIRALERPDGPSIAIGAPIGRRSISGPEMPALAFVPVAIRLPLGGGYLVAVVNISFLELQYRPLLESSGAVVSLLSFDGTVLMDAEGKWRPGLVVSGADPVFGAYLPGIEAATFRRPATFGKSPQIVSFRVTRSFPVVVTAGIGLDRVWAAWLATLLKTLVPTVMAVALVLFALRHLARQFDHIVAQEKALRLSRDAAEAASEAKSRFLAVMSHEIRTPMNAVIGLAASLLDEPLSREQRQSVCSIHDAGDSLLVILNDVLDYSRLVAGELAMEPAPFAPAAIVDGAVDILRPLAEEMGLALDVHLDGSLPANVLGDGGRLRQVLINVLSNAVKFTERGRVGVAVTAHPDDNGRVRLVWTVRDTGIGIAPERIGTLFREFVQADSTIHRRFGGSGLGLAISRRILEQMGGTMTLESEPGVGTVARFEVALPVVSPPSESPSDEASVTAGLAQRIAGLGERMRLLVVDDNEMNHLVVRRLLRQLPIAIDIASDGVEAVSAAEARSYHAILMDARMPGMDGQAAARAIRGSEGPNAHTPIVALTANAMSEDIAACTAAGMNGCLTKPVRRRDLVRALTEALSMPAQEAPARQPVTAPGSEPQAVAGLVLERAVWTTLREDLGAEGVRQVIEVFVADTRDRLDRLSRHHPGEDRDAIEREAHTIKSGAATVGLMRLSREAAALELAAKACALGDYERRIAALQGAFDVGKAALLALDVAA